MQADVVKLAARRRVSRAEFQLYTPSHKKSIDKAHKHWCVKFPDFVYFDYCNTATYLLYYNCPKGEGLAAKRQDEKNLKKI